ncbi:hypothetical protein EV128_11967 [Rhizobium azibense]|nr:hypothetical protein EV128_11967 [Rhizobium azibense]
MAERWNSMPHFVASLRDTALSTSRIPVLGSNPRIVTRNRPRRVRAVNETTISRVSSAPKKEGWLRHASVAPFLTPQDSR